MREARKFVVAGWLMVFLGGFLALSPCRADAQTDFGSVDVGGSKTLAVTVAFPRGGSFDRVAVVTKGAPNLDFTDAGGGTCVAGSAYAAGASCVVHVAFSPRYGGLRMGAVVVYAGKEAIAKAYIHGNGSGGGRLSSGPSPMLGQASPELPRASPQAASAVGIIYTVAGHCVWSPSEGVCALGTATAGMVAQRRALV